MQMLNESSEWPKKNEVAAPPHQPNKKRWHQDGQNEWWKKKEPAAPPKPRPGPPATKARPTGASRQI